jgi:sugar phosphate isomerase/epimerase
LPEGALRVSLPGAVVPLDRLGVQLYTLRSVMADAPEATLAALAEIGYAEVELAGLYGWTPAQMRARLDAVGLVAASSHHGVAELRDGWERTLEGARVLGQSLIVVPSIPGSERTPDGLRRVADDFNRAAEAAAGVGLRFGYHNHDWEFAPLDDGTVPMRLLLDRTDPDLVDWQMDVFWTVHAGADPVASLQAEAGRVTSLHLKDRTLSGDMVDVGSGVIDFSEVIGEAERNGLLHAFVEHDRPDDPLDSVRRSYRALTGPPAGRDAFDERIA